MIDIKKIKKAYFIGIGGIGISALAQMLLSLGIEVHGINDEEEGDVLRMLQNKGIKRIYLQAIVSFLNLIFIIYNSLVIWFL